VGLRQTVLSRVTAALSPSGKRALLILIYHRVLLEADPMRPRELDARAFQWHVDLLAGCFNVLPLTEACLRLKTGTLPERAACITFDDGYADNMEVALPILKRAGLAATFFVASGFLNGGRMWNDTVIETLRRVAAPRLDLSALALGSWDTATNQDRHRAAMSLIDRLKHMDFDQRQDTVAALASHVGDALPVTLMMSSDQVRTLVSAGMEVGAHTVNHPILTRLDDQRAYREIHDGRESLEEITGNPVTLFAYPNGKPGRDYDQRHVAMVKRAGFRAAVSTQWGVSRAGSDRFQLPRFTPWHVSPAAFHMALVRSYFWKTV
jgi:peptidoglycan/xylan/chitin deacetylase (PgdA/CDA1 family)